jgi:2,4-dienoyl-CoA reductase-like NADH-dependent reductase (Old Yellow Enzyme family)
MSTSPLRLFEPCRIGPITLRNRTVRAAAFEGMAKDHEVTPALVDYHRQVAEGGVGMTTVAYAAVERSGLAFAHQLWLRKEAVSSLRTLTDVVHAAGARASIQLGHCGNMAKAALIGERPISASAKFNLYGPTWPREMNEGDIARTVARFGEAVEVAREAGFDAVEVHAGHGYLISQFLSPYTNRRRDAYGGPLERRMRYMREVMGAVRTAAGSDLAVLVKMNLRDGFAGGGELEDALVVARALEEAGADALVLSGGFVSRAPMHVMRGAMPLRVMGGLMAELPWLRLGLRLFGRALIPTVPYEDTYFLDDARAVRAHVKLPLVYVGGASSRASIDRVLGEGFDAVAMARALIRDPAFVRRLEEDDARSQATRTPTANTDARCDHCNYCAARIYTTSMACHLREPPPASVARFVGPDGAR